MKHVVYCFDQKYEQHFGASVTSLLLHAKGPGADLCIHIVTVEISAELRARVDRLADIFQARFEFHQLQPARAAQVEGLPLMKTATGYLTAATYYRVLLPDVLSPAIDKVVYLDADTIVLDDIGTLYGQDLGPAILGAALDQGSAVMAPPRGLPRYVNAGVMVMDLQRWRQGGYVERCLDFARQFPEKISYGEQCSINQVCTDFIHVLDPRWNRFVVSRPQPDDATGAGILHYITGDKPWHAWYENNLGALYWRYLDVSPWAGATPVEPGSLAQARRLARLRFAQGRTRESMETYERIVELLTRK